MTFAVPAEAYDRFIGRYSREIAPRFLAFAGIPALARGPVLDVGCGPGSLLVALALGFAARELAAVDLSEPFVAAARERVPGADVRHASAEALPFRDRTFAAALSQLVLSFVPDAPRAAAEMARVVRPGGVVAACTFEENGLELTRLFWEAAHGIDPAAPDSERMPLRRPGELAALWRGAGLLEVEEVILRVEADYDDFEDLWSGFTHGIGPAGSWLVAQPEDRRAAVRNACFQLLGRPPRGLSLPARVVAVRGRVQPR